MEGLQKKLETIFEASGGKKVDIVSHSMGGLLVKSFLALHHEVKVFTSRYTIERWQLNGPWNMA
jgi:poly(3-hydroxyalkanoate) synthetase